MPSPTDKEPVRPTPGAATLSDEEVVRRVRAGEVDLFETLMRRYNQRIYRIARSVMKTDGEAEDLVQETWVRAYEHLSQFAGRAAFSTWLARIALHEGWARARRRRRFENIAPEDLEEIGEEPIMKSIPSESGPERDALGREVQSILEAAIEALPESYRTVFVLREVEELTTAETAECLELSEEAVKTRLHRARAALQAELLERTGGGIRQSFPFLGSRCDRTVERVLSRIREGERFPTTPGTSTSLN